MPTQSVIQRRVFYGTQQPDLVPPTWTSKFTQGDIFFCPTNNTIYTYNFSLKSWEANFFCERGGAGGKTITGSSINASGHLIISYSDSTSQDVGKVVGDAGQPGATPIFQSGNTTTLPAGSSATATVRLVAPNTYAIDMAIPQGQAGSGGGGGNISVYGSMLQLLKSGQTTGMALCTGFHSGTNFGSQLWYVDTAISAADQVNHFKSSSGANCWHRVAPTAGLDVTQFGAPSGTKTLAQYGYTQTDVNLLFDSTYGLTIADFADDAAWITTTRGWLKGYMFVSQSPVILNISKGADAGKQNNAYNASVVVNSGNGMRINLVGQDTTAIKRKALDFNEAENSNPFAAASFHLSNYNVVGIPGKNQAFSDIDASYGATIRNMHYNDVDYPTKQYHCMLTGYYNNIAWNPIKGYLNASMVGYPGANETNSGGNMSTVMDSRVYATGRTVVGWETNRSSSPRYLQNIFEGQSGSTPVNGILIDYGSATTCKDGEIDGFHSEITASDAMIRLKLPNSGNFKIRNLWNQYPQRALISNEGSTGYPNIVVQDFPWMAAGTKFKSIGGYIYFDNATENDLSQAQYWTDAPPVFFTQIRHTGGLIQKSTYPFKFQGSMTLNDKDVATK